ncbi:nucleoside-diphosphate-sugar epimerase [Rhizomicrobium palustre]|uniref:Nucleoside-diphosphate-sugar epimerase n=1 Tax=Rhizomicrobium palustre TaxID=189966 RepID=A0A846MU77_9PROT|nr:NAD-dependent epimerase/dehydratase family protein [Rhizomicrobium palustre]NIK86913.1 nucleoside-diphosphate-sugar epimerase [Rhizomicrobium palustre]
MFSPVLARQLQQSNLRFVITGGGSWLGQASLLVLENAFGDQLPDRVAVFGSQARSLSLSSGRIIESAALSSIENLPQGEYIFLHYAFITKGHVGEHSLQEFVRLNAEIADLTEGAARRVGARGLFLPSSGAVYRKEGGVHTVLAENPYGFMKLEDEARFRTMCKEIGCALMPIRVFNVAGPCVNNVPAFALSSIISDILKDKPVTLRAIAPVYRSYVHIVDLIEMVLSGLMSDSWGVPAVFDTAGEEVVEVGVLARRITDAMGLSGYPIERPEMKAEPIDYYVGDRAAFVRHADSLGIALKPLQCAILDTVSDLKQRFAQNRI